VGGAHGFAFDFVPGALPHAGLERNPRPLTLLLNVSENKKALKFKPDHYCVHFFNIFLLFLTTRFSSFL